jgi:hypothetical protein
MREDHKISFPGRGRDFAFPAGHTIAEMQNVTPLLRGANEIDYWRWNALFNGSSARPVSCVGF